MFHFISDFDGLSCIINMQCIKQLNTKFVVFEVNKKGEKRKNKKKTKKKKQEG